MDDTGLDDTRYYGSDERDGESVIDVEFERRISVVSVASVSILER